MYKSLDLILTANGETMDLMKIGTELFMSQISGGGNAANANVDQGVVMTALGALLGGADGKLDLGDIVAKFTGGGGGLMAMANSWLGDGANDSLDVGSLVSVLGEDKIGAFASTVGVDSDTATSGLAGMIPELINQGSSGGSLLDLAGGAGGVGGILKKLF